MNRLLNLLRLYQYVGLICCLIISACTTMPAKQAAFNQNIPWPIRQKELQHIKHWQINGAIAIKINHKGQTASLSWQQQPNHYHINLFGPLGTGRVTLSGVPNYVTLFANGKQFHASTPEQLMQKILGWHVPISSLYFWVRGLPATNIKSQYQFDAFHHLQTLSQQGWQIHYQRYTAVKNIDLPSQLFLKNGDLQIKIIISEWKIQ